MEVEERRKKIAELKARREAVQKSIEEKNEDGQETKKYVSFWWLLEFYKCFFDWFEFVI